MDVSQDSADDVGQLLAAHGVDQTLVKELATHTATLKKEGRQCLKRVIECLVPKGKDSRKRARVDEPAVPPSQLIFSAAEVGEQLMFLNSTEFRYQCSSCVAVQSKGKWSSVPNHLTSSQSRRQERILFSSRWTA